MIRFRFASFFAMFICLFGCGEQSKKESPEGLWRAQIYLADTLPLPFFIEFIESDSGLKAAIYNGNESIVHDKVFWRNDSLVIPSPYFHSVIVAYVNKNVMSGYWTDSSREGNYTLKFDAKFNLPHRFSFGEMPSGEIDGVWQTLFSPGTEDEYPAIGIFNTDENSTKGTFLTETGDYRFLEGGFGGGRLKLSAFDGSHAFLFDAVEMNDTLKGWFYSGKHHKEPFIAWRNDTAKLKNPYSLTELSAPNAKAQFTVTDLNGQSVVYPGKTFNKPLLIQVMGSWCPNCMDESVFLSSHYDSLKSLGIEVVAISFERLPMENALPVLQKLKTNLNIPYPVFYGGKAGKSDAQKVLPFLAEVKSYPTLIFVHPNGEIFKIHTGFYGPGTGTYFELQSKEMMDDFKLLSRLSNTK